MFWSWMAAWVTVQLLRRPSKPESTYVGTQTNLLKTITMSMRAWKKEVIPSFGKSYSLLSYFHPSKSIYVELECLFQSCKCDCFCSGLLQVSPCVPQQLFTQGWDSCVACCSSGSRYQPVSLLWPSGCWEKVTAAMNLLQMKLPAWWESAWTSAHTFPLSMQWSHCLHTYWWEHGLYLWSDTNFDHYLRLHLIE